MSSAGGAETAPASRAKASVPPSQTAELRAHFVAVSSAEHIARNSGVRKASASGLLPVICPSGQRSVTGCAAIRAARQRRTRPSKTFASRSVMLTAAVGITAAGLVPKFAALLYTVPAAVLGGACIFLTGIMLMAGLEVIQSQPMSLRTSVIVGTSLALGIGFGSSGVLDDAPMLVSTLLGGIPGTALIGGLLNVVLPQDKRAAPKDGGAPTP